MVPFHASGADILYFKDLPKAVRQIAEFINVTLSEDQVDTIAAKNRFETRQAEATEFQKLFLRQGRMRLYVHLKNTTHSKILHSNVMSMRQMLVVCNEIIFHGQTKIRL